MKQNAAYVVPVLFLIAAIAFAVSGSWLMTLAFALMATGFGAGAVRQQRASASG